MIDVYIDMDDTLVDFINPVLEIYNKEHGTNFVKSQVKTWSFDNLLEEGCGEEIFNRPDFFKNLKAFPNAIEILKKINDEFRCYLITNPSGKGHIAQQKYEWIEKHLPFISCYDQVIMSAIKQPLYQDGRMNILVDDAPKYLSAWNGTTISMIHEYNSGLGDYRVPDNNFNTVYHIIKLLNFRQIVKVERV